MESHNLINMFRRIIVSYETLIESIAANKTEELWYFLENIKNEFLDANSILITNRFVFKRNFIKFQDFANKLDNIIMNSKVRSKKVYDNIRLKSMKNEKIGTEVPVLKEQYVFGFEYLMIKPTSQSIIDQIEGVNDIAKKKIIENSKDNEEDESTGQSKIEDIEEVVIKKKKTERIRRYVFIYRVNKESILKEIINEYEDNTICDDMYAVKSISEKEEEYWLYIRMNRRVDKEKMIYKDMIIDKIGNRNNLKEFIKKKGLFYKIERIKKSQGSKKKGKENKNN